MTVAVGFNSHQKPLASANTVLDEISNETNPTDHLLGLIPSSKAAIQLGTLGGGQRTLHALYKELSDEHAELYFQKAIIHGLPVHSHDKKAGSE